MKYGRNTINKGLLMLIFLAGCLCGCVSEDIPAGGKGEKEVVSVTFALQVPDPVTTRATLSDQEKTIREADVLVFDKDGFRTSVAGTLDLSGELTVQLSYTKEEVTLWVLANTSTVVSSAILTVGMSPEEVAEALSAAFDDYAQGMNTYFPMFAEKTVTGLTEDTYIENVRLIRAFAKIEVVLEDDVFLDNSGNTLFELKSIRAYKANSQFQLVPDADHLSGDKVTAPSVPTDAVRNMATNAFANIDGGTISGLYLPESQEVSSLNDATIVVVGGAFSSNPSTTLYYRIDLIKEDGVIGRILRNHKYVISVASIEESLGAATPDIAANNSSAGINVDIIEWEEDGTDTIYDKEGNYFQLSDREILLHFYQGSVQRIVVESNMQSGYTLEWADENGETLHRGKHGPGNTSFDNGLFKVEIVGEGGNISSIIATALQENPGDERVVQKLLVTVGNVRTVIRIEQETRWERGYVHIFNLMGLSGDLGDNVMMGRDPSYGDCLRKLLEDESLYGFNGTLPFAGFKISGVNYGVELQRFLLDRFDVVLIPYNENNVVSKDKGEMLKEWLEEDKNRVLVVYTNNQSVLSELEIAITSPWKVGNSYYTINTAAPDVFTRGRFGTVSASSSFYVYGAASVRTINKNDYPDITPLLMNGSDEIAIGVDMQKRIVYCTDYFLYMAGYGMSGNGISASSNDLDRLIANLWGWIADTVLADEYKQ